MAQYTATVYANNGHTFDKSGKATTITGAQVNLNGKTIVKTTQEGYFYEHNALSDENIAYSIEFLRAGSYPKKRLIQTTTALYIRNKSSGVAPTVKRGTASFYIRRNDPIKANVFFGAPFTDEENNLKNIVLNSYNNIIKFSQSQRVISLGAIDSIPGVADTYLVGTANSNYTISASLTIDSHLGQYPPRQIQIFEDVAIIPGTLSPSAGFVNEKIVNRFSWSLVYDSQGVGAVIGQKSAVFQWRVKNAATINTINVGTNQFVDVPANTLPNGEFEWRVQITSDDNITSPFSNWLSLTTIDAKPNVPTGLYPNTGTRDGSQPVQFTWIHSSPLSTPQAAFELQITYDNQTTWKALSDKITTANTQFTAAANTILPTDPTGRFGWRVRTFNSDNVASDWSSTAFFIVHPASQTPSFISVESGRSRPLVRWISLGQIGYQLQITQNESIVFDTGEIFGAQTEYRIPEFLQNGSYVFKLRIKNIRGLWSSWANFAVSINARHSLNIILSGEPVEGGAALTFDVEVKAGG